MNILLRRRKLGNGSCLGMKAVSTTGLEVVRNDHPFPASVDWIFRWGCTSSVPDGARVVNSAESIHWCSDKRRGRLEMQAAGISVPETHAVESGNVPIIYPLTTDKWVGRPVTHAQGRRLVVGDTAQVTGQVARWGGGYISRLIDKVAEYRVAIIQNRVAWVAQKTPGNPEDVAWNVARGGRFDNVRWDNWPMEVVKEALKAAKVSGTDFCGVDVMVDAAGKPWVLEINSAPSQTSPYRQQCFAKCFDHIITNNSKAAFPDPERIRTWKAVAHPAIRGR